MLLYGSLWPSINGLKIRPRGETNPCIQGNMGCYHQLQILIVHHIARVCVHTIIII